MRVGSFYKINYRTIPIKTFNGYFQEQTVEGVGELITPYINSQLHLFQLADGRHVYATSRGVIYEVTAPSKTPGVMVPAQLQSEMHKEAPGDPSERAEQIAIAQHLLSDLGIEIVPDSESTYCLIDYSSIVNLKMLTLKLLSASIKNEYDDLLH